MKPEYDRSKYLEYINNSEEWKLKRREVFLLKGRQCERCGSKGNINVHHGTYARLFNEDLTDLFVLCELCHQEYHYLHRKISVQSTTDFIDGKISYKTVQKNKKVYVESELYFEPVNFCKDCGLKLKKYKTEKHKANPKTPVSPFYYKCMKCRKVYFPKYIKKPKQKKLTNKKKQKRQKMHSDFYRETKFQKHEELKEMRRQLLKHVKV